VLELSQRAYIEMCLRTIIYMHNCSGTASLVVKGNNLGLFQSSRNQLEIDQIKLIPYALVVRNIMNAQVRTRPHLAFISRLLVAFQSNIGMKHWKTTKKALHCMQGTKYYMLMYKRTNNLKVIGYSEFDFAECVDI
jgi:hypothetical protein